jgi:hypothetical protein
MVAHTFPLNRHLKLRVDFYQKKKRRQRNVQLDIRERAFLV